MIKTKYKTLLLVIIAIFSLQSSAQEIKVEGTIRGDSLSTTLLLITLMGSNKNDTLHLESLPADVSTFYIKGKTSLAADSLYLLMGIIKGRQILHPLRIAPGEKIKLVINENGCECDNNNDNRALSAFSREVNRISRTMWKLDSSASNETIEQLLGDYYRQAETAIRSYNIQQSTKQYLRLWAYTSMKSQYNNLDFITKRKRIKQEIPAGNTTLWPDGIGENPHLVLDTPMALYFHQTPQIITAALPQGSVAEQLQSLCQTYHCEKVRTRVTDLLLERFISHYDYAHHYSEGLEIIRQLSDTYQLDDQYVKQFMMRRYSSPGSPFPEEVILTDSAGTVVDFSSFLGKYVYIDLWASWCKPCIGEIPYLQEMEKEMSKRDDLILVSVSIDQSMNAWKKKMKELNLHGWQLLDKGGKISKFLNINSIPFFLLYDKEGKLLLYGAPRPSSGDKLRQYLELLD